MQIDPDNLIDKVRKLAAEVGGFIREESTTFSQDKVEVKGLNDLVSYVDKEAEKRLVEGLKEIEPSVGFITEEGTVSQSEGGWRWIIDPLDGTTNFIHGIPVYSVSVALAFGKELKLGVVYEVNRDECFWADSKGAYCNEDPIGVSSQTDLSSAIVATGFPYHNFEGLDKYMHILTNLMEASHGLRRFGSAAVDLAYVACGRFEAFFEYNLNPWDIAAGAFIVQQAGGRVTDFSGGDDFLFGREICAGNTTQAELLALIQKHW